MNSTTEPSPLQQAADLLARHLEPEQNAVSVISAAKGFLSPGVISGAVRDAKRLIDSCRDTAGEANGQASQCASPPREDLMQTLKCLDGAGIHLPLGSKDLIQIQESYNSMYEHAQQVHDAKQTQDRQTREIEQLVSVLQTARSQVCHFVTNASASPSPSPGHMLCLSELLSPLLDASETLKRDLGSLALFGLPYYPSMKAVILEHMRRLVLQEARVAANQRIQEDMEIAKIKDQIQKADGKADQPVQNATVGQESLPPAFAAAISTMDAAEQMPALDSGFHPDDWASRVALTASDEVLEDLFLKTVAPRLLELLHPKAVKALKTALFSEASFRAGLRKFAADVADATPGLKEVQAAKAKGKAAGERLKKALGKRPPAKKRHKDSPARYH